MALDLLTQLRIGEVSVVDRPATELDGFMLLKAKNPAALVPEFRKLIGEITSADLTDDEKVAAMRKALRLAPASVREAMEQEVIAQQALMEKSGSPKQPTDTRSFWKHGGASLIR